MSRIGRKPVPATGERKNQRRRFDGARCGPQRQAFVPVSRGHRREVRRSGPPDRRHARRRRRRGACMHGLTRSLIANMVQGVTTGYTKKLEIVGVGYQAQLRGGDSVALQVGYANQVVLKAPQGVKIAVPDPTHITISGADKQAVGQFAAEIRDVRRPEPYKGKGIRYEGEAVRRKAGKAFGSK